MAQLFLLQTSGIPAAPLYIQLCVAAAAGSDSSDGPGR